MHQHKSSVYIAQAPVRCVGFVFFTWCWWSSSRRCVVLPKHLRSRARAKSIIGACVRVLSTGDHTCLYPARISLMRCGVRGTVGQKQARPLETFQTPGNTRPGCLFVGLHLLEENIFSSGLISLRSAKKTRTEQLEQSQISLPSFKAEVLR